MNNKLTLADVSSRSIVYLWMLPSLSSRVQVLALLSLIESLFLKFDCNQVHWMNQEEKMKKNSLKILALLACMFSLASCGGNSDSAKPSNKTNNTASVEPKPDTGSGKDTGGKTDTEVSDKNVSKIAVKTNPTKMSYKIGETFNPAGGVLTVTYKNKSTAELDMTDSRITYTTLNTTVTNANASIKITFGGKNATLRNIVVTKQTFDITFETNEGSEISNLIVEDGSKGEKPADPTKSGYTFDGWYIDSQLTLAYDWNSSVTSAITLYAKWLTEGATTYNVTFNYNHYGAIPETRILKVESGKPVSKISVDPSRKGYDFGGWVTSTGADYDFTTNVTGDLTLTANWKRSTTEYVGAQTYKFEAEDIDFTGIIGAGLSGTTTEAGAIVTKPGFNASGDKFVSYMYKRGNTLKFEVISDVAKTVTLKASMSQEIENYSYNKDNYQIMANGKILDYGTITFSNVPARVGDTTDPEPFKEFTLGTVDLKVGNNEFTFMTNNSDDISGTTMAAHAPLLDYIALSGDDFVAEWDNVKGYPVKNY